VWESYSKYIPPNQHRTGKYRIERFVCQRMTPRFLIKWPPEGNYINPVCKSPLQFRGSIVFVIPIFVH
jgi:hypothetical protein